MKTQERDKFVPVKKGRYDILNVSYLPFYGIKSCTKQSAG